MTEHEQAPSDAVATETQTAPLSELREGAGQAGNTSLDSLMDLSLPVTIEFGRTTMLVQEVLAMGVGAVVQLDRMVGEPIDIYVSDRKFAEGEVVVVGEHFGVRITKIIGSPTPSAT